MELILSLFPGIDLLGRGFSANGYCVVKGPDTIWDERIEEFHLPAGRVTGIIGGPPCQHYSDANRTRNPLEGDRLVLEFLRVVWEGQPEWFLMENVRNVPTVEIEGYSVQRFDLTDAECGGRQKRLRHIQFGSRKGDIIRPTRLSTARPVTPAVLCALDHRSHAERLADQGMQNLPLYALTKTARARAVGNAVSFHVASTLARAVTHRSQPKPSDCPCGCGRTLQGKQKQADQSCRKRQQRLRDGDAPRILTFRN